MGSERDELQPAGFSGDDAIRIGEAVRAACVRAAVEAYERARMDGVCDTGALEVAIDAVRSLDVTQIVEAALGSPGGC